MAIYDVNSGGTSYQIGKIYDVNTSGTATQIGKVYDVNIAGTSTLIYTAEETIFSSLAKQSSTAYGTGTTQTTTTAEYSVDADTMTLTGTAGSHLVGQGTYGYAATVYFQGYSGSWSNLKTWSVGGNASTSTSVSTSVSISGYTKVRFYLTITTGTGPDGYNSSGYVYISNMTGIAS